VVIALVDKGAAPSHASLPTYQHWRRITRHSKPCKVRPGRHHNIVNLRKATFSQLDDSHRGRKDEIGDVPCDKLPPRVIEPQ
jgi:hypothetical protein